LRRRVVKDPGWFGIRLEPKGPAAEDLIAGDGRAPVFFYVPGDKISAGKVVHKRFLARIVHGVSQVAHQDHILTLLNHLADRERTAKYAHVLMHAHDHDVGDASLPHKVVGFRAVSDGITVPDFNGRDLMPPWGTLRALGLVIAPTVGVVDGQG